MIEPGVPGSVWWFDTDHDYNVDESLDSDLQGFPIVGDDLYRGPPYRRLMLHAGRVSIDELRVSVISEPDTGFLSPGPGDLVLD